MRFSPYVSDTAALPFAVLEANGRLVYSNSIFKAEFGEHAEIPQESFTCGGRRYLSQRSTVTLSGREYTVCAVHGGIEDYPMPPVSERFTSLFGLLVGVSSGAKIRKRPCGVRYLLSLFLSLIGEELDEDVDIDRLDGMGMGVYSSLNAQGLLIVLACLYRLTHDAALSVAVSGEGVLIRVNGSKTAEISAFMYDFLCELARASGFALDFCDGGAAVTLKRFSATAFTAFSPTKEYAEEAMQLALLGLM